MCERRATDRGATCASAWDEDWVALVNEAEDELGRRISGAVAMHGWPCPRASGRQTTVFHVLNAFFSKSEARKFAVC